MVTLKVPGVELDSSVTASASIIGKGNSSVHESGAGGNDTTASNNRHEGSGIGGEKISSHNVDIRGDGTSVDQDIQRKSVKKLNVHVAASVIQRAWRRHNVCFIATPQHCMIFIACRT